MSLLTTYVINTHYCISFRRSFRWPAVIFISHYFINNTELLPSTNSHQWYWSFICIIHLSLLWYFRLPLSFLVNSLMPSLPANRRDAIVALLNNTFSQLASPLAGRSHFSSRYGDITRYWLQVTVAYEVGWESSWFIYQECNQKMYRSWHSTCPPCSQQWGIHPGICREVRYETQKEQRGDPWMEFRERCNTNLEAQSKRGGEGTSGE